MEENQLLALWESYDRKLSQNLVLNRQNAEEITKIKVKSLLSGMQPIKIFAILVGIVWVVFLDLIVFNVWAYASPMFLISIGFHILLTKLSIGVYLYQLVLINLVDILNIIRAASACRDTDICMAALFAYVLMSGHCTLPH